MLVVQVIETREEAGTQLDIEFVVYRSPSDPNCPLTRWNHSEKVYGGPEKVMPIGTSKLGTPIEEQYLRALGSAIECRVPFLWVNDPEGLFPRSARPPL
jgi:hypothetical protein